ncbi:AraC family transcriptional regulator [Undibacterium sp. RTI2.1]|uniref:helix-turn-helix domain-containing protein n=1 Tax=unclassified Undibacterium TaxID=2630295 RepID=UPI002AB3D9B6|nr:MULTISPECIES: AraC family transcriptional regulator [unclassified Undibacterium]MDY7538608.1 AraC family transcriptional regulator [Undibacterium sp. 5I1]MEB0031297.1 AraC family transcriptional regulator [Undibacterium sp. RTI2.1]MEB0116310.1 AraC family transcriptional regulator [Undibacterium sp. RTI2.2]MEB0231451.1 AraC family transcriptional regulator [Undibacterium sp. 10I3]MEB0258110.1 AraC family transcriptional regulator [Undibacterium sp. 5I1]
MIDQFASGQYYGTNAFDRRFKSLGLSHLRATVHEHDVEEHSHTGAHIVLATRGRYVTSASGTQRAGPVLVYNPPDVVHRDRFAGDGGWFFAISFNPEDSRELLEHIKLPDFAMRHDDPIAVKQAFGLLQAAASSDASRLDLETITLNLLASFYKQSPLSPNPPPWLRRAQEMIADRSTEDLGIADIADAVGVHRVYLARQYLRHIGCTPGVDLRRRRVEHATQLMMTTDEALCDIALASGFCDQSHLNRAFLHQWGLTPTHFAKLSSSNHGFKCPRSV